MIMHMVYFFRNRKGSITTKKSETMMSSQTLQTATFK